VSIKGSSLKLSPGFVKPRSGHFRNNLEFWAATFPFGFPKSKIKIKGSDACPLSPLGRTFQGLHKYQNEVTSNPGLFPKIYSLGNSLLDPQNHDHEARGKNGHPGLAKGKKGVVSSLTRPIKKALCP
jgi:hypothetical protein